MKLEVPVDVSENGLLTYLPTLAKTKGQIRRAIETRMFSLAVQKWTRR